MDSECYFYEQTKFHTFPKRMKKIPEDLPDSLKFAHLNPKAAAFLANKEKQKHEEEPSDDELDKKSLKPEISQAFDVVKSHLDSYNEEDSQRYLFEEAKFSADNILRQLSNIIYYYDNIASHIPRSLEYYMMSSYTELTTDVQIVHREWQTHAGREAHFRQLAEIHSEGGQEKVASSGKDNQCPSRTQSQLSDSGHAYKKRLPTKSGSGLPEIVEDSGSNCVFGRQNIKLGDGSMLQPSRHSKQDRHKLTDMKGPILAVGKYSKLKRGLPDFDNQSAVTETASDIRSTVMANPSYYMSVIQFQLSSKVCEDKGWIYQKGKEEELAKEAILEYCVQRLQQELKNIKEQRVHEAQLGLNSQLVIRYYGDTHKETLLKYRKLPSKISSNTFTKDGKPCIPNTSQDLSENRLLMLTTHIDGTTVAFYPSGRPAVIASAAGVGRPGFYTIAYDDDRDMKMLAAFTPCGRGVCYHMNGNVRFLWTIKGGHIANKNGKVIRHWKWPQTQVKLLTPVQLQLNQHLSFRCAAENYSVIVFTCQKETARFFVNATHGASNQKRDENFYMTRTQHFLKFPGDRYTELRALSDTLIRWRVLLLREAEHLCCKNEQLLTSFNFSSKAAKELLKLHTPKSKLKSKKKKDKLTKQLAELVKSVDKQDKLLYELESDKELARLQRKAKNLVDDWLEHYRVTIGLKSPTLTQLSETPRKSFTGTLSAKTADRKGDKAVTARTPSAPAKASVMTADSTTEEMMSSNLFLLPTVAFSHNMEYTENDKGGKGDESNLPLSTFSEKLLKRLSVSSIKSKSGSTHTKPTVSYQSSSISLHEKENTITSLSLCPVSLRKQFLSNTSSQCHCSRDTIPYITDVEYETYINELAPQNQLQVIAVVSSLYPQTNHTEAMLNQIYEFQNRNRTRPCLQSRSDIFRILRYDINTAMHSSGHTEPYLLRQHNVVPGMFLIYAGGNLLFCDHIFNGYGNAKRDFKKQVMKSRLDFLQGLSLPKDFRFSPSHGPHGLRSPWGGEIGGTGVDHFGSPGTALVFTLTDITKHNSLADPQTDNLKLVCKHIGELINLQEAPAEESSRIPELPPINHLSSQKSGHCKTSQHELVSGSNNSSRLKQQTGFFPVSRTQ